MSGGIGDVSSNAKGSGARYNSGKVAYELLPLRLLLDWLGKIGMSGEPDSHAYEVLLHIARWQASDDSGLDDAIAATVGAGGFEAFADAARVFEYGKHKYAAWNWAKGMPWSVPLGCIVRHALALLRGEQTDPESGVSHLGHIQCNLIMLKLYAETYPEGDDRPKGWLG